MRIGPCLAVTAVLLSSISCNRDPNVIKQKYLQTGNKYFSAGKYREASILYRSAIKKDGKFGEAYYRWALAELKQDRLEAAIRPLRVSVELLADGPESRDAKAKLANIYLSYLETSARDNTVRAEVERLANELAQSDAGAFDAHRLRGRLAMLDADMASRRGVSDRVSQYLQVSIDEFRQADAIRPFQIDILTPLARSLISSNQLQEAEKTYLSLLHHDPSLVPIYGELYNLYARQRRLEDAEKILKEGMAKNPGNLLFIRNLATHYQRTQRNDEALKMIEQFKTLGRGTPHIHQSVGAFYVQLGQPDMAMREYEAGIQDEPKEKNYYRKRMAETLVATGKRAEAGRMIESVLKEDPKDAEARLLLGSNLLATGDVGRAVTELQAAVQADLENAGARYMLGSALAQQGQPALAVPELQRAMQLDPNFLEPRLELAQLQILLNQSEGAIKTTQNILEDLNSRNVAAKLLHAVALRNLNRVDEARAELQAMLKLQPGSPDVLIQLGELYVTEKNYKAAEQIFRDSYKTNSRDTRGLLRMAQMYIDTKQSGRAIEMLRQESRKHPERLDLRRALADMSLRAKDYTTAIAEYQLILGKVDPALKLASEIRGALGEAYRANGQYDLALKTLQQAKEGIPNDPTILSNLAVTLLHLGRNADAKQLYEGTFNLQAENPIALNNLAYLIADKNGDLDTALTFAQRARQKWPHVPEVSDTLAWIYLKKNLNDNAIEILENIVAQTPNQPTFHYHLGAAWLQKGNKAKARNELEKALANRPSTEESVKIKELLAKTNS